MTIFVLYLEREKNKQCHKIYARFCGLTRKI
jgi:hypothetical protein